jgi:hypothetical protein
MRPSQMTGQAVQTRFRSRWVYLYLFPVRKHTANAIEISARLLQLRENPSGPTPIIQLFVKAVKRANRNPSAERPINTIDTFRIVLSPPFVLFFELPNLAYKSARRVHEITKSYCRLQTERTTSRQELSTIWGSSPWESPPTLSEVNTRWERQREL